MKDFPAVVVANYFVVKGKKEGSPVEGVLKLIKLVYIAHGWHLGVNKKPFIREKVEAWKYGPVIRSVYDAFKHRGKLPITDRATTGVEPEMKTTIDESIDKSACQFLDKIWNFYRDFLGLELSKITHKEGTPWHDVWHDDENQNAFGIVIEERDIKEYYGGKFRESRKSE